MGPPGRAGLLSDATARGDGIPRQSQGQRWLGGSALAIVAGARRGTVGDDGNIHLGLGPETATGFASRTDSLEPSFLRRGANDLPRVHQRIVRRADAERAIAARLGFRPVVLAIARRHAPCGEL